MTGKVGEVGTGAGEGATINIPLPGDSGEPPVGRLPSLSYMTLPQLCTPGSCSMSLAGGAWLSSMEHSSMAGPLQTHR